MTFSGTVTSDFLKYLPADLDDREKLIDYSSSDFNTIRQSLINYSKAVYPLDYNNFSESDFGTFLIELMAAVGHIQSIKSDYIANENYLKTARDRKSVKKLLELIGVRMKGPISSAANVSITVPIEESNASSVTILRGDRSFTIQSPEDSGSLTYTIYKIKNNGTVDLEDNSLDLIFDVSSSNSVAVIRDAIILEGSMIVEEGVFSSPETIKSIELSEAPYVENSAQIFITSNGNTNGIYKEVENLYFASGSEDRIFQIITDDNYKPIILFGDSILGQSPAIGDSYTISYRVGGGSRGNLAADTINVPIPVKANLRDQEENTVLSIISTLENTSIATGGSDAETIAHAKRYAPLVFRRQDRLVTLIDYKSFVNTFISSYGSSGKASAVVRRAYSSANIIDIFVLEKASDLQLRKATPEYKRQLLEAIEEKKMLTDEPVVVDGLIRTLDLMINIAMDRKFKKVETEIATKVRIKILEYFNVDNTDFGEPFVPQDLIRQILEFPEVRYATVDNVESTLKVNFNEVIQINNLTINTKFI